MPPTQDPSLISDGYHTFAELYEHRHALTLALMRSQVSRSWFSRYHEDGKLPFDSGHWFIVGIDLLTGTVTYHLPLRLWFAAAATGATELPTGKPWDGHRPQDVVSRLIKWATLYTLHQPKIMADIRASLDANRLRDPSDEEIDLLWDEVGMYYALYPQARALVRAALGKWGLPKSEPSHEDICQWIKQQGYWGVNAHLIPRIANMFQDALARWGTTTTTTTHTKPAQLVKNAESDEPNKEQIEEAAKLIYASMRFAASASHGACDWIERGNSLMQDEARRTARTILAGQASPAVPPESENTLATRVLAMCKKRNWSLHWAARGAYLHLEASELIEALRGKRGDPLAEAADVLLVLMSITESAGFTWSDVIQQTAATCSRLETCEKYPGEERIESPAAQPALEPLTQPAGRSGLTWEAAINGLREVLVDQADDAIQRVWQRSRILDALELMAANQFTLPAPQAGEVQPAHPTFLDAIRLAQGCHDYSGGHGGQQGEAFQDGIGTVVAVLKKAAVGPWDSQTMAVFGVGSAPQAGEEEV